MLQVDDALKKFYKSDSTDKNLILEFYRPGQEKPFLGIWEPGKVLGESMTITESLSGGEDLDFGSCEATQISLTLIDVNEEIKGAEMAVYQTLEGLYPSEDLYPSKGLYPSGHTMPLGRYVVQTTERKANRKYRDLAALDLMCRFDVNVAGWYNALPFPLTLREFRSRLCSHIGVTEHVPDYLPNDGMLVDKTVETSQLMGRDALIACEQANGAFGHFDRKGVLQHVILQPNDGLYPAPGLYPSDNLYPENPGAMNTQVFNEQIDPCLMVSCRFEEYTVQGIEKVQVRQEEGDIGAVYGAGENCLTVEGNFLLFGKDAAELGNIARGIYGMVGGRMYVPYECSLKGLPYMEVGDSERFEFGDHSIVSYVIKRTLKGISALRDAHSATGGETRSEEHSINTEIIQLKGKAAVLKRNVDEVSAELVDFEKETAAKFAITAEQISAEVKRAQDAEAALKIRADEITMSVKDLKEDMESQFEMTAGLIALKVSKGDVSSQLSVEPDDIIIKTNRFSWEATNSRMTKQGDITCRNMAAMNAYISGILESGNFLADDSGTYLGDYEVSVDGSNIFRSTDGSVEIQTRAGGPYGSYPAFVLNGRSGETILTDHSLGVLDVYPSRSWWKGWTLTDVCEDLWDAVFESSDEVLKQNIKPFPSPVSKWIIQNTKVRQWLWKEDKSHDVGMVAQELQKTLSEYGIDYKFVGVDSKKGTYYIDYKKFIPLMILAIQDIYKTLETL